MSELEGRSAIITGAGGGIGAGIARVFAREGASVVVTDINGDAARACATDLASTGGTAIGVQHDVSDAASCADVVARAREAFGVVDILVNNAAIDQRIAFTDIDEAAWDRMIDVNLKGVYLMTRAVINHMLDRGTGCIVNTASLVGKAGALPLFSHYVAAKFGVVGLTQCLAAEFASRGVRVNAVCPGVVRTPLWEPLLQATAAEKGITVERAWQDALAPIPMGVPQDPEDIGEAIAFLASDRARYITGETVNVNGGQLMD